MQVASISSASPICAMSSSLSSTSSRHEIAAVPERGGGARRSGACSRGAREGWRTRGYDYGYGYVYDYDYDHCCCDYCDCCGCCGGSYGCGCGGCCC